MSIVCQGIAPIQRHTRGPKPRKTRPISFDLIDAVFAEVGYLKQIQKTKDQHQEVMKDIRWTLERSCEDGGEEVEDTDGVFHLQEFWCHTFNLCDRDPYGVHEMIDGFLQGPLTFEAWRHRFTKGATARRVKNIDEDMEDDSYNPGWSNIIDWEDDSVECRYEQHDYR